MPLKKKIPKVKVNISISLSVDRKIKKIMELSSINNYSYIVNYVLLGKDSLDELIEYYSDPKNQSEEGEDEWRN